MSLRLRLLFLDFDAFGNKRGFFQRRRRVEGLAKVADFRGELPTQDLRLPEMGGHRRVRSVEATSLRPRFRKVAPRLVEVAPLRERRLRGLRSPSFRLRVRLGLRPRRPKDLQSPTTRCVTTTLLELLSRYASSASCRLHRTG